MKPCGTVGRNFARLVEDVQLPKMLHKLEMLPFLGEGQWGKVGDGGTNDLIFRCKIFSCTCICLDATLQDLLLHLHLP